MASEFVRRVRHVEDINTFSKSVLEEGDLVLTNDNKMYALIGQEFKQLDNMEKVWATSEAGKYLMVGDDGIVKPMVIDDILGKDNTFTGSNTFKNKIIATSGVTGNVDTATKLQTRQANFTSFTEVATNMLQYAGLWYVLGDTITGAPYSGIVFAIIEVIPGNTNTNGIIKFTTFNNGSYYDGLTYVAIVTSNGMGKWIRPTDDSKVLHNSGNETASGDKTFNGQTTLLNGNFGLRVTNTGIFKTTDAGKNWVAL